jgi:hypothetical protein
MGMTMVSALPLFATDYAQILGDVARSISNASRAITFHAVGFCFARCPRSQGSEPLAWGKERDAQVFGPVAAIHWKR